LQIVGKQNEEDVWIFNPRVHLTKDGIIPEEERVYVCMEASQLPFLHDIGNGNN
jgi:hypothetical protein